MQVLDILNCPHSSHLHPQTHSTPKKHTHNPMHFHNHLLSEKKKHIPLKTKPNLPPDLLFSQFKQNHPKNKPSSSNQPQKNHSSHPHSQMAPFSSVLNTKPPQKIKEPTKPMPQSDQCEQIQLEKKEDNKEKCKKQQTKKCIEKMIEKKLNHMIENKRKSMSFKADQATKQNINRLQKRKQSYHVEERKKLVEGQLENRQKQDQKDISNKQKNSMSFIIRSSYVFNQEKMSSNAVENERKCEKMNKNIQIQSIEREELIKSQNSKYKNESNERNRKCQEESGSMGRYVYKPSEQQMKKLWQRQGESKESSNKGPHVKGVKSLKVRVNKVLKAQQQMFNQKYFPGEDLEDRLVQMRKSPQQIQQHNNFGQEKEKEEMRINENLQCRQRLGPTKQQPIQQINQRLVTIEQILQQQPKKQQTSLYQQISHSHQRQENSHFVNTQQSKDSSPIQPIDAKTSQSGVQPLRAQLKYKSYKETSHQLNPTNRKRISSIRAIQNYYKKIDTQQKSSFITYDKQLKQTAIVKKKTTDSTACLTHKIKWGSSSKRKLNSDRISIDAFKCPSQFATDLIANNDHYVQSKLTQISKPNANFPQATKATIQAKKLVPTTCKKRQLNKVQFLEEEFMKVKEMRTPKADKNLEKIFAQTINSKELIEYDPIVFQAGSKSLIIFEDPGISMIINNNNSIHSPKYPIGFNGQVSEEFINSESHDLSPLAMTKKRGYDMIEEKFEEEPNAMESLQELYFELKSRKDINQKAKENGWKIESVEELCEG